MKVGIYFPKNNVLIPFEVSSVEKYEVVMHKLLDATGSEITLPFNAEKHKSDLIIGNTWGRTAYDRDFFYIPDVDKLLVVNVEFIPRTVRVYVEYPKGASMLIDEWKNFAITNLNDIVNQPYIVYRGVIDELPIIPRTEVFWNIVNVTGIDNLKLKAKFVAWLFRGKYVVEEPRPEEMDRIFVAPPFADISMCGEFIREVLKISVEDLKKLVKPLPREITRRSIVEVMTISLSATGVSAGSSAVMTAKCEFGQFVNNRIVVDRGLTLKVRQLHIYANNYPARITAKVYDYETNNLLVEIPVAKVDSTGFISLDFTRPLILTPDYPYIRAVEFVVYNDSSSSLDVYVVASVRFDEYVVLRR